MSRNAFGRALVPSVPSGGAKALRDITAKWTKLVTRPLVSNRLLSPLELGTQFVLIQFLEPSSCDTGDFGRSQSWGDDV